MSEITDQLVRSERENPLDIEIIERLSKEPSLINKYKKQYGGEIYSFILDHLTHKNYPQSTAERLWSEIVQHKRELNSQLGRDVGISVAALDYMTNIVDEISLAKVIDENTIEQITEVATRDNLTQLYKRVVFNIFLKEQCNAFNRYNKSFSLVLIDIDDFKMINDTYGHQKGDEVLEKIGTTILELIREPDIAARYGGEELAVILPQTDCQEASVLAERLRETIENKFVPPMKVTVSIGLSCCPYHGEDPTSMLKSADDALYKSKSKGKNCVTSLP